MEESFSVQKADFKIIKQKIILTNHLLQMYNKEKENLAKATEDLKNVSDRVNILKIDNERLNDELVKLQHQKNDVDVKLKETETNYGKLEELYQKNLIENQLIISDLELKLKECMADSKLKITESKKSLRLECKHSDEDFNEIKLACTKLQNSEIKIKNLYDGLLKKYNVLKEKKSNGEITKKFHEEQRALNAKLQKAESLISDQNQLQENLRIIKLEHQHKIARLNENIMKLTVENKKLLNHQFKRKSMNDAFTQVEHNFLHNSNANNVTIKNLEDFKGMDHDPCEDSSSVELFEIFQEMRIPKLLTPLSRTPFSDISQLLDRDENLYSPVEIPNITITPPTPKENIEITRFTDDKCERVKNDLINSNNKSITEQKNRRRKFWIPFPNNTIMMHHKKKITRKNKVLINNKNDLILNALKTLKENNINFTISTDSLILNSAIQDHKMENTYSCELSCANKKCLHSSENRMLMKYVPGEEEPELLGFFPSRNQCNLCGNNKMYLQNSNSTEQELLGLITPKKRDNLVKASQVIVEQNNKESNNDIKTLAEKILEGIKGLAGHSNNNNYNKKSPRKKSSIKGQKSSFDSTTESELEKLFKNPSNILVRNRSLLAKARAQNSQNLESDSDFFIDSGIVTAATPEDSANDKIVIPLNLVNNLNLCKGEIDEANYTNENRIESMICPQIVSPLAPSIQDSPPPCVSSSTTSRIEIIKENVRQKITFDNDAHQQIVRKKKKYICGFLPIASDDDGNNSSFSIFEKIREKPLSKKVSPSKLIDNTEKKCDKRKINSDFKKPAIVELDHSPRKSRRISNKNKTIEILENKIVKRNNSRKKSSEFVISSSQQQEPSRAEIREILGISDENLKDTPSSSSSKSYSWSDNLINTETDHNIINIDGLHEIAQKNFEQFKIKHNNNQRKSRSFQSPAPENILSTVIESMNKNLLVKNEAINIITPNDNNSMESTKNEIISSFTTDESPLSPSPLDCPKSPDLIEIPDELPKSIPLIKSTKFAKGKMSLLLNKLLNLQNNDDVVHECASLNKAYLTRSIFEKLSSDIKGKVEILPCGPPLSATQRILIGFLIQLDKSSHPGIIKIFLRLSEKKLYNKKSCSLEIIEPITRVYTAICKMNFDLHRIRKFICESLYFAGDKAIPIIFYVLNIWTDILRSESNCELLDKTIIEICYRKTSLPPKYKLKQLFNIFETVYGYSSERSSSVEDIFNEIFEAFLKNPSEKLQVFTLLIFLRNRPFHWVMEKIKEKLFPLYQTVPASNSNLKATLLILIGNICHKLIIKGEPSWKLIKEIDDWAINLQDCEEDFNVQKSLMIMQSRLPKKSVNKKKEKAKSE